MPNAAPTSSPTGPPPSARARSWAGIAAMVLLVLGLPALLRFGSLERKPFDEKRLETVAKEHPSIILLGDSMLGTRIDEKTLDRASGRNCFVFAQPASSSATWYLMMKNFVAEQKPPPKAVILFYRDRQLTLARHRTQGAYRKALEPFMRKQEPVIVQLLGEEQQTATGGFAGFAERIYPPDRARDNARLKLDRWALDLVATSREYDDIRESAKQLFSLQNLRGDNDVDEQKEGGTTTLDDENHDFAANVGQSFLPHILEIAKSKGIALLFYEVKRRPSKSGVDQPENAIGARYDAALKAYVEARGAFLYDETDDADITVDLYGSGDHIAEKRMKDYTSLFWPKVAPLIGSMEARRP